MPTVIIGCRVLEDVIRHRSPCLPATFLDYGLHRLPARMRSAIQDTIDSLPEPSTVLVGYGLCGNGVVGLRAGRHTLVFPRADDCIALLLGSDEACRAERTRVPGTYYLSAGWLECGSHPLREYEDYRERFGDQRARWLIGELYRNYSRVLLAAADQNELTRHGPEARRVAAFLGANYEEAIGSGRLVARLLETPRAPEAPDADFVVVGPGEEVAQEPFLR